MATPCIYTLEGKDYTYAEFTALLHDGLLDKLRKDKVVVIGEMPKTRIETLEEKKAAAKARLSEKITKFRAGGLGMNKIPLDIIPELIELAKIYVEEGAINFKDFIISFRKENPEFDNVTDADIKESVFDKVLKDTEPTEGKTKTRKISERFMESDNIPDDMKRGLKEKGIEYFPKSLENTKKEAAQYVDIFDKSDNIDAAINHAMNLENGMKPDVRTSILAQLAKRFSEKAKESVNTDDYIYNRDKAIELTEFGAKFGTESGRAVNAQKVWKEFLGDLPEAAPVAMEREFDRVNADKLEPHEKSIRDAVKIMEDLRKELLESPEFEEAVSKEVDKRAKENRFKLTDSEKTQKEALKRKYAGMFNDITNIPKLLLEKDFLKYGKLIAKDSAYDFTEFSKRAIDELGDKVKPILREWFDKSSETQKPQTSLEKLIKRAEGELERVQKEKKKPKTKEEKDAIKAKKSISGEIVAIKTPMDAINELINKFSDKMDKLTDDQQKAFLHDALSEMVDKGVLTETRISRLYAKAMGLKHLTEADVTQLIDIQTTINNAAKVGEEFIKDPSYKNQMAYRKALKEAQIAAKQKAQFLAPERTILGLLGTNIRGNLMTPISLIANPLYNITTMPIRFATGSIATAGDYILSQIAKTRANDLLPDRLKLDVERTTDIIAMQKAFVGGMKLGAKEAWEQLFTGQLPEDVQAREIHRAMQPFESAMKLMRDLKGSEKVAFKEHLANAMEATLGIYPEAIFRLLNLGDKPFRKGSEKARIAEIGTILGLKGDALKAFIEIPDEIIAHEASEYGKKITLQNDNIITDGMAAIGKSKKVKENWDRLPKIAQDFIGLMAISQSPYIKIPTNVIIQLLKFHNPELSVLSMGYNMAKGNRRAALHDFGTAVVAYSIQAAALQLANNGILTSSIKGDDEKESSFRRAFETPSMINMSALNRLLTGGNPKKKSGDIEISVLKLGVVGALLGSYGNITKGKTQAEFKKEGYWTKRGELLPEIIGSALEMPLAQSTSTLLSAIKNGGAESDRWLVNTARTLNAAIVPNLVSTISRADDKYIRDTKNMELGENLKNTFKTMYFMGDEVPAKISIWGEKVKNVPKGRDEWAYYLFDVSKYEKVSTSTFGYPIYKLYKETMNKDVMPPTIDKYLTVGGKTKTLTARQVMGLKIAIGKARKSLVSAYVGTADWENDDKETKISTLKDIYKQATEIGTEQFKDATGMNQ